MNIFRNKNLWVAFGLVIILCGVGALGIHFMAKHNGVDTTKGKTVKGEATRGEATREEAALAIAKELANNLNQGIDKYSLLVAPPKQDPDNESIEDELAVISFLQYRKSFSPIPGSPFIRASWSPQGSSNSNSFRLRWTGKDFEIIDPGEPGSGILVNLEGSDYTRRLFRWAVSLEVLPGLDRRNAESSLERFGKELGRSVGLSFDLYNDQKSLFDAISTGECDVITMRGYEYLLYREELGLVPRFIVDRSGSGLSEFILIMNKEGIKNVEGGILLIEPGSGQLPQMWLEEIFAKDLGLSTPSKYFKEIKFLDKPSDGVLKVFMGTGKAAVVRRETYEQALKLNPSLKSSTAIIKSPRLADIIVCTTEESGLDQTPFLKDVNGFHERKNGASILSSLKVNNLSKFEPEYIGEVHRLYMSRLGRQK